MRDSESVNVNIEFRDANGRRQTRTLLLLDAMALARALEAGRERSTRVRTIGRWIGQLANERVSCPGGRSSSHLGRWLVLPLVVRRGDFVAPTERFSVLLRTPPASLFAVKGRTDHARPRYRFLMSSGRSGSRILSGIQTPQAALDPSTVFLPRRPPRIHSARLGLKVS